MADKVTISVAEVTVTSGKKAKVDMIVDDKKISIPVSDAVKAYFNEQFVRTNPTQQQKKRFATMMNLLRAAYKQGVKDASK